MNCDPIQQQIEEHLAVGVPADLLPGTLRHHLDQCEACAVFVAENEELNRLLEEPLPFPPADLTERVMLTVARDQQTPEPVSLGGAERLVWAAMGAAAAWVSKDVVAGAALGLQVLWQSLSETLGAWTATAETLSLPTFSTPLLDPNLALAAVAGLAATQMLVLWRARHQEAGR